MTEQINNSPAAYFHRSSAWLVGSFASGALVLGLVGPYGVVAYSVRLRTREIGVRMALGGRPRSVYRLILGEVGRLVAAGTALGIGGSLAAARLIRGLFYGMSPWDISNRNNRICGSHLCLAICELLSGTSCGFRQRSRHVAFGV